MFLSSCNVLAVPMPAVLWSRYHHAAAYGSTRWRIAVRGFAALRAESLWLSDHPTTTVAAQPLRHSLKALKPIPAESLRLSALDEAKPRRVLR